VFTALAGGVYGLYVGFIDPNMVLGLETSIQIVVICIIGGVGTIAGPVIGSLVLVPLSEALRSNMITDALIGSGIVSASSPTGLWLDEHLAHAHVLIYGVLVVVAILYMPEGIAGSLRRFTRTRRT
jgi:branched-chain amino acid transport system permease protein